MFKVVQINTFPNKATGSIMFSIHNRLVKEGIDSYVVWGRGGKMPVSDHEMSIKSDWETKVHGAMSRMFDNTGHYSVGATKRLLERLEYVMPDIIHLHNIHGYYINIDMLFQWIKYRNIPVVWTFHDCWPFTGHCSYFDFVGCEKWQHGCHDCEQTRTYPASLLYDNSKNNWLHKKNLFHYDFLNIVTPSEWLRKIVGKSFFHDVPCSVIHNGINTEIFKPSDNKEKRGKFRILGVASEWTPRKGLNDFIRLRKMLSEDCAEMVVVGLDEKQKSSLPPGIIGLKRTDNIEELVKLYQNSDLFFNPTYEDNYPTTNLEALACGTPVCTYATGGSLECVNNDNGFVLQKGDVGGVKLLLERYQFKEKMGMHINVNISELSEQTMASKYVQLYNTII